MSAKKMVTGKLRIVEMSLGSKVVNGKGEVFFTGSYFACVAFIEIQNNKVIKYK